MFTYVLGSSSETSLRELILMFVFVLCGCVLVYVSMWLLKCCIKLLFAFYVLFCLSVLEEYLSILVCVLS